MLLNPPALRHAGLNLGDPPVPLSRVVVTRIDDDQFGRLTLEQAGRQVGDVLLGNGHDDDIVATGRFLNRDGPGAGL